MKANEKKASCAAVAVMHVTLDCVRCGEVATRTWRLTVVHWCTCVSAHILRHADRCKEGQHAPN